MPKRLLEQMKEIFAKMDQGEWAFGYDTEMSWYIYVEPYTGVVIAQGLDQLDAKGIVFFHNNMREIFRNVVEIL